MVARRKLTACERAIRKAERLLPGTPKGDDLRWQAMTALYDFIEEDPQPIWEFVTRWWAHPQEDLRAGIACCVLEHVMEYHFDRYFPEVEAAALADPLVGGTVLACGAFGQSAIGTRARKLRALQKHLARRGDQVPNVKISDAVKATMEKLWPTRGGHGHSS